VEGGVVEILRPWQPVDPSTRPITCDTSKIHSNHLVDHLGLAVRLQVESYAHV
jgi:hypothetical protein